MGVRSPVVLVKNSKENAKLAKLISDSAKQGEQELYLIGYRKTTDGKVWALISTYTMGVNMLQTEGFDVYNVDILTTGHSNFLYPGRPKCIYPDWNTFPLYKNYNE